MSEADQLEEKFPCHWRSEFSIPTFKSAGIDSERDDEVTYLCGNSLGLMPRSTKQRVLDEVNAWSGQGVLGHHHRIDGRDPWITNDERVAEKLASLVFGCLSSEVSCTGTLTSNLNALMQAFYKPDGKRYKILCEAKAFPSDIYSLQNQVRLHGYDPSDALILADCEEGEDIIHTEAILKLIADNSDSLAVVLLPGIQFYSGQYFDIPRITKATKEAGAIAGWDLAHASGNVPLKLHEWNVDFAVFCSYKYLNSGAGNVGGLFVHDDISKAYANEPRAAGWWGVDIKTRFNMEPEFVPAKGARGFAQSNVTLFGPPCLLANLEIVEKAGGIEGLDARRRSLVDFLRRKLKASKHYSTVFHIMTDKLDASECGCQLSLKFTHSDANLLPKIVDRLFKRGIIGDERKPNVLRWAPTPLYNTHHDVEYAANSLETILDELV